MAVCSVSVVPVGTGSTSVSSYVARCQEVLKDSAGVKYRLTPMATVLEGDVERLLEIVLDLHRVPFGEGAKRVLTTVIIDDRTDKPLSMEGKIEAVEKKLR
ncbi:MAG TPA: MTH1187 family thiamine-binding protein [Candidatus Eisenbacteria bacterium]|uniref:MTH1187 family thiamine-binding protein n=1 Tax=Eiseniibacteriota bacterium TaxID=2212470 RepID=A0A7V2F3U7_UNCEI|nr:MTH1187 family thiamine-binding protein [Candidatus Eisenbacteria bacterium]